MPRPLCVLLPEIGVVSETFIRWDVHELLPGGTVVIADPPPAGDSVRHGMAWDTGECPTLAFAPLSGDPPPRPDRASAVAGFLATHRVEAVLVEYLDFADRWFDALLGFGVRVWLRGHGVDVSARLTEQRWRDAYRRYDKAEGIIVPSAVAAKALVETGLPADMIHVVRYCVDHHAGIPEVVTDRFNGRLVAEYDVAGMAAAVLDLAVDPTERQCLGQAARATIEHRHGAHRTRHTLQQLLGLPDIRTHRPEVVG